uniref:Endonuclease/exonuclease/phosphatase domain-containing protein n=1 Tax=Globodera rostochiensis TaxID=31243 RepID=A0A914H331_GLORO
MMAASIFITTPGVVLMEDSDSCETKRKVIPGLTGVMAIPTHKLFVWQQQDIAQTSCASKTNNDPFLQFALEMSSVDGTKSKRVYMKRPYDDPFSAFKGRLRTKVKDLLQWTDDDGELPVQPLYSDGHSPAVEDIDLFKLFFNAEEPNRRCASLQIANIKYDVVRDPAWLDKIEIALLPLVGCPIFPSCNWKYTTDNKVRFLWFVAREKHQLGIKLADEHHTTTGRVRLSPEWEHVHTGPFYSPTTKDVGKFLAVVVDFGDGGIVEGAVCSTPVAKVGIDRGTIDRLDAEDKEMLAKLGIDQGTIDHQDESDEELIFERRQRECCGQQLSGNGYRIMSYNILAGLYLKLNLKKQEELFFPYCPKHFQGSDYRYPLILRELEGYNADLIFLQEVDFRMQKRFLAQFLLLKDYSTVFNCKENEVNEGLLIAFRNERFHSLAERPENFTVKLSTFLANDPANEDIRSYLTHKPIVSSIVTTRPTILQLIRLRTRHDGHSLLCANTHLYFDPAHEEVKIIQSLLCLRYINKIREQLNDPSIQVIFAGDFNSEPKSRAVELIRGKEIGLQLERGDGSDCVNNSIQIKAPFESQCLTGFPEYTNYTNAVGFKPGYIGCLDYIWANPPLHVERVWPMPDHQLVTKYGALPSPIAPSDHLPILCEVQLLNDAAHEEEGEEGKKEEGTC